MNPTTSHFFLENNLSICDRTKLVRTTSQDQFGSTAYCIEVEPASSWKEHEGICPPRMRYHGLQNAYGDGAGPVPADWVAPEHADPDGEASSKINSRPALVKWLFCGN